ncbi:uncharacterized protein DKFZp434B061-like [Lutra lutra]|uniref:uncharacterized protein DKFZp434B061-like n=1 Tax=Lutra lutra TaxID=9657 RepID=UPI001FD44F85|nr:uncharacterized protein DKFZp434B061-like [Lutra lutra]
MLSILQLGKGRPTLARSPTPSSLILEPVLLVAELTSNAETGAQHNSSAGADVKVNLNDGAAVVRTSPYLRLAPNSPVLPQHPIQEFSPEKRRATAVVGTVARPTGAPVQASALPRPPPAAPRRPNPPSSLRPRPRPTPNLPSGPGSAPPGGCQAAAKRRPSGLGAPGRAPPAHSPRSGPPAATLARSLAGRPSRRRKCGPCRQSAPRGRSRNVAAATLYGAGPTGKKKPFASFCLFPFPAPPKSSRGPEERETCGRVPLCARRGLRSRLTAARAAPV